MPGERPGVRPRLLRGRRRRPERRQPFDAAATTAARLRSTPTTTGKSAGLNRRAGSGPRRRRRLHRRRLHGARGLAGRGEPSCWRPIPRSTMAFGDAPPDRARSRRRCSSRRPAFEHVPVVVEPALGPRPRRRRRQHVRPPGRLRRRRRYDELIGPGSRFARLRGVRPLLPRPRRRRHRRLRAGAGDDPLGRPSVRRRVGPDAQALYAYGEGAVIGKHLRSAIPACSRAGPDHVPGPRRRSSESLRHRRLSGVGMMAYKWRGLAPGSLTQRRPPRGVFVAARLTRPAGRSVAAGLRTVEQRRPGPPRPSAGCRCRGR